MSGSKIDVEAPKKKQQNSQSVYPWHDLDKKVNISPQAMLCIQRLKIYPVSKISFLLYPYRIRFREFPPLRQNTTFIPSSSQCRAANLTISMLLIW